MKINYSFSLSDLEEQSPVAQEPDLIAFAADEHHYLPNSTVLVRNDYNGKQTALSRDVYIAMDNCRDFRTVEEHIQYLSRTMPELSGRASELAAIIQSTEKAGLMLSAKAVCQSLPVDSGSVEKQEPITVWITTCDRPELTKRLLQSIVEHSDPANIRCCYLVDDSRDPQNTRLNEELVESFNNKTGFPLVYVGHLLQNAIIAQLIDRLPEHEDEIRFLLDPQLWQSEHSCGRARNFGLLLSIDSRTVLIDDDVVCKLYRSERYQKGVEISEQIREADFFQSREACFEQAEALQLDPLAEFTRALGTDLSQALKSLGVDALKPGEVKGASVDYLKKIRPDSKVMMTACGTLGDPGASIINWLPSLSERCRERLLGEEGKLDQAFELRHLWLGRSKALFANHFNMSPMTGMDNRELLPPYFPIFRGEDLVFGCMVDFLYPHSLALDYPWAVPHLPQPERKGYINGDSLRVQSGSAMVASCIQNWKKEVSAVSVLTRMEVFAGKLTELCERDVEELMQLHLKLLTERRIGLLFRLEELLKDDNSGHQRWLDYLNKGRADNYQAIQAQDNCLLDFGKPGDSKVQKLSYLCDLGKRYARALKAWPTIRTEAVEVVTELAKPGGSGR